MQLLVDDEHGDINVLRQFVFEEFERGLTCEAPRVVVQPLENQTDQAHLPQWIENLWATRRRRAAGRPDASGVGCGHQAKARDLYACALIEDLDILGLQITDWFSLLVPHDHIQQYLLGPGANHRLGRGWRRRFWCLLGSQSARARRDQNRDWEAHDINIVASTEERAVRVLQVSFESRLSSDSARHGMPFLYKAEPEPP